MVIMEHVYYDISNPASYSSRRKLQEATNKQPKAVTDWLKGEETYTLHKPVRKRFPRNPYITNGIDREWQMDLADLKDLKDYNNGVQYLLFVIDIFSKYLWVIPLMNKSGDEIIRGLELIFKEGKRKCSHIMSDRGREFTNNKVQKFLKNNNINFIEAYNPDVKAAIVERVIRTIKEKLWKYFHRNKTHRYVDVLQDVVNSYNNSVHRTIGMAPSNVTSENSYRVWIRMYKHLMNTKCTSPSLKQGDYVRVSREKGTFEKSYKFKWSLEIFKVKSIIPKCRPLYILEDLKETEVRGRFYQEELQCVKPPDKYDIEKVLKSRGSGKNKQLLVKWLGYPDSFRSWVSVKQLT